jgi:hypothetical protein
VSSSCNSRGRSPRYSYRGQVCENTWGPGKAGRNHEKAFDLFVFEVQYSPLVSFLPRTGLLQKSSRITHLGRSRLMERHEQDDQSKRQVQP